METVEVVIRIPKEYKDYIEGGAGIIPDKIIQYLFNALDNGTVLPKGHTDLIDRQALIHSIEQKAKRLSNLDTINGLCGAVAIVFDAPTIIETDKEVENDSYRSN